MHDFPRVTFGMIVLNGEPFLRYNLRSLYPFAHEIIVVEGASHNAAAIANSEGHSNDTTLATLHDFKTREDPENKLIIITAEDNGHPNGFWPGEKDEQSRAYADRATGEYVWQVDVDEFYRESDMVRVLRTLAMNPSITAVSFKQVSFWGGFDYVVDGFNHRAGAHIYHRLFKWGPGYRYVTHRPPTVADAAGNDLRCLHWIGGDELCRQGINLYHYCLLFPKQVWEKAIYYSNLPWGIYSEGVLSWAETNYLRPITRPFQVHNVHQYASWLKRFEGEHPLQIRRMRSDLEAGLLGTNQRDHRDAEQLLRSKTYLIGIWLLEKVSLLNLRRSILLCLSALLTKITIPAKYWQSNLLKDK
jgi:hypothetical protein